MTEIVYSEDGPVASITLNRPESLNAFNRAMRLALTEAVQRAGASNAIRVLVVSGAGRGFSAGTDVKDPEFSAEGAAAILEEFGPGILAIAQCPKPVIAAVQGFAAGIGVSYALACDLVVMGDRSFLQLPFAQIALIPDGGLCWQLAQRVGYRLAFELAVEGKPIAASRCVQLGLANRAVPDDSVGSEALAWASALAAKAPLALAATKQALRFAASASLEEVIRLETRLQQECAKSADFKEGVDAFLAKRRPRFEGR